MFTRGQDTETTLHSPRPSSAGLAIWVGSRVGEILYGAGASGRGACRSSRPWVRGRGSPDEGTRDAAGSAVDSYDRMQPVDHDPGGEEVYNPGSGEGHSPGGAP